MSDLPLTFPTDTKLEHAVLKIETAKLFSQLVKIIWKAIGFRFHFRYRSESLYHAYYCAQDKTRYEKTKPNSSREVAHIPRFVCESSLTLSPCYNSNYVQIRLVHHSHAPYHDNDPLEKGE